MVALASGVKRSLSRRNFMRVGATGLAAAASLAAIEQPANATCPYFCCNLARCPKNYDYCAAHADYIWGCYSGSMFCRCCEALNYTYSAIRC